MKWTPAIIFAPEQMKLMFMVRGVTYPKHMLSGANYNTLGQHTIKHQANQEMRIG